VLFAAVEAVMDNQPGLHTVSVYERFNLGAAHTVCAGEFMPDEVVEREHMPFIRFGQ
jgi:hypothetical protein